MQKQIFLLPILVIGLFCFFPNLNAAKVIYEDALVSVNPVSQAKYIEDTAHTFSLEEILALDSSKLLKPEGKEMNFVRSQSKFWIVFDIENQTEEGLALLVKNAWINYLSFYVIDEDGNVQQTKTGNFTPFDTRDFKSNFFTFDLGLHPSKVVIETNTLTEFNFSMVVVARKPLIANLHISDLFNGLVVGALLALLFYNFFLFLSIRDKSYFWYVFYLGTIILSNIRVNGLGHEVLWPEAFHWNGGMSIPFGLNLLTFTFFYINLIDVKKYSRPIYLYFLIQGLLSLISILSIILFSTYSYSTIFFYFQSFIIGNSGLLAALYLWYKKGNKIALYFFFIWLASTINPISHIAAYGLIEDSFFVQNYTYIVTIVQAILMSALLAYKYNTFKQDALNTAEENQIILENQNIILEKKVTERTTELREANTQLETLNQTKDRLFAIIGHDLRKPVVAFNGISETINYLVKKEDYSTLQQLGTEIEKDGFALQKLTDNLLNWALMQRDVMPYNPKSIELSEKIEELTLIFDKVAADKNIELISDVPEGMVAYADPNALLTILINLTDNALKYTLAGGQVKIVAQDADEGIQLSVIDNGVGMSAEQVQQVFELKQNKSQKGTNGEKGTGLGLHLVKELVKMNKGEIKVESIKRKGTNFMLKLPAKQS